MLETYRKKRDFSVTPEPSARKQSIRTRSLRFVIQKHAATRLHFDFRLELDGVLKSWAVPKGPSLDTADKRLAVMVEDHPLEYADFEGTIPQGEYGGGEVIVWDRGEYAPLVDNEPVIERKAAESATRKALKDGKISIFLKGKKLEGAWALVRMKDRNDDWLLLKENDEYARTGVDITADNTSALSDRKLEPTKGAGKVALKHDGVRESKVAPGPVVAPTRRSAGNTPNYPVLSVERIDSLVDELQAPVDTVALEIDGNDVRISSLNKTLWPSQNGVRDLTKRDLVVYLARCSNAILPHLRNRPLTLSRYPDGVGGESFFQRHWHHTLPEFVDTVEIYSDSHVRDGKFIMCNNLPTLLWLGQIANIEIHSWFSRDNPEPDAPNLPRNYTGSLKNVEASLMNYPDFVVFDLDPYIYSGKEKEGAEPEFNKKAFAKVCEVAIALKKVLDGIGWSSYVKTSGKTGLHIYIPVDRRYNYDVIRRLSETIGRHLMAARPDDITMDWSTAKRRGKIFLDHNMNARSKTIASVYSPRPNALACVSMPLKWNEVENTDPREFTILGAPKRLAEAGDLWGDILRHKNELDKLRNIEEAIAA